MELSNRIFRDKHGEYYVLIHSDLENRTARSSTVIKLDKSAVDELIGKGDLIVDRASTGNWWLRLRNYKPKAFNPTINKPLKLCAN